jgi:hypothetical protein
MVSTCKRSINIVNANKPKVLSGLTQTGMQREQGLISPLSWATNAAGEESGPKLSQLPMRNTVSLQPSQQWESDL